VTARRYNRFYEFRTLLGQERISDKVGSIVKDEEAAVEFRSVITCELRESRRLNDVQVALNHELLREMLPCVSSKALP
jgi:hypothetical protein